MFRSFTVAGFRGTGTPACARGIGASTSDAARSGEAPAN